MGRKQGAHEHKQRKAIKTQVKYGANQNRQEKQKERMCKAGQEAQGEDYKIKYGVN